MSQGQPLGARKRACSATKRSNQAPADSFLSRLVFVLAGLLAFLVLVFFVCFALIAPVLDSLYPQTLNFTGAVLNFQATHGARCSKSAATGTHAKLNGVIY